MDRSGYVYVCSIGETWDEIARTVYGDEKYAKEILCVNPALCKTVIFGGGEEIYLPVIENGEDGVPEEYTPLTAPWKD